MKNKKLIEWTPPILGWQYRLDWKDGGDYWYCSDTLNNPDIDISAGIHKLTARNRWTIQLSLGERLKLHITDEGLHDVISEVEEAVEEIEENLRAVRGKGKYDPDK